MALQGDLNSFALPDVLRLLAGTGKSGRLAVSAEPGNGEVILCEGAITTSSVTSSPDAAEAADVLLEILRFGGGSFLFEEGEARPSDDAVDVESAIVAAEALQAEWIDVETVVPSMEAWISLLPELGQDEVVISAEQWRALAAIAGGGNVRDLGASLELADLAASKLTKELVESDLVAVRPSHGYTPPRAEYSPPEIELDSFEEFEVEPQSTMTDLEDLAAEDRPVVMEDSEDAMLPEPLPGEGVAYDGESITGVVDGRAFESFETFETFDTLEAFESVQPFDSTEDLEPYTQDLAAVAPEVETESDPFEVVGDAAPFSEIAPAAEFGSETSADPVGTEASESADGDDERGSLLRFLSTVKP